jgi:hypothetical protein
MHADSWQAVQGWFFVIFYRQTIIVRFLLCVNEIISLG